MTAPVPGFCRCGKPRRTTHCYQCIEAWLRWWAQWDRNDPILDGRRESEWREIEARAAEVNQ